MYLYFNNNETYSAYQKHKVKFDTTDHSLVVKSHLEQLTSKYKNKSITFQGPSEYNLTDDSLHDLRVANHPFYTDPHFLWNKHKDYISYCLIPSFQESLDKLNNPDIVSKEIAYHKNKYTYAKFKKTSFYCELHQRLADLISIIPNSVGRTTYPFQIIDISFSNGKTFGINIWNPSSERITDKVSNFESMNYRGLTDAEMVLLGIALSEDFPDYFHVEWRHHLIEEEKKGWFTNTSTYFLHSHLAPLYTKEKTPPPKEPIKGPKDIW